VTQVYVSIDAATKESLRKIDRPLFTDFWERFLASIDALSRKQQRTVFRLTLVKSWNMDELRDYASLIERGKPEFVEVKGVTYCGESTASDLTMKNVPYHHEVVEFCRQLVACTPGMADLYDLACEHEHSCCMLIAQKKFKVDGRWNTWIDYDKFLACANAEQQKPFSSIDYMAETPSWAVYGAAEHGFDPAEVRFMRKQKAEPATGGC
jgi:tRNA wybutosine-synthesizing protein 1